MLISIRKSQQKRNKEQGKMKVQIVPVANYYSSSTSYASFSSIFISKTMSAYISDNIKSNRFAYMYISIYLYSNSKHKNNITVIVVNIRSTYKYLWYFIPNKFHLENPSTKTYCYHVAYMLECKCITMYYCMG